MKRHVIVPDIQIPHQNQRQVASLAGFIRQVKPDVVWQVGDLIDHTNISRWVRGKRGEYVPMLRTSIDETKRTLEKLKIDHWKRGNHDERLDKYVEEHAPGIAELLTGELSIESLFGLDSLGVKYHRGIAEMAPNLVIAHGDEGPSSMIAGQTALKLAERIGKSVVCSHVHRQGISNRTESFNGVPERTLQGIEAGHMMDMSRASYLKGQYANWQAGFAVIDTSNLRFHAQLVQMSQTGSFLFEGQSWEDGKVRKGKRFVQYVKH